MEYIYQLVSLVKKLSTYFGFASQQNFEDLFYQLLHEKNYDEALKLAQQHVYLDIDMVYKCKWRNRAITVQSINNVLGNIQDKLWAISDCVKTVPTSYEACRTLIEFGLREANLRLLYQLGNETSINQTDHDEKRKKSRLPFGRRGRSEETLPLLGDDIDNEAIEGLIDFDNLNDKQKELCRCRQNLIRYEHSLFAYENILGDYREIQQHFDHVFYHDFRQKSPLSNCIYYSNDGDAHAVEILLNFYTDDLAPHILSILSNFPETSSPFQYRNLLPCLREDDVVYEWRAISGQIKREELDWSDRNPGSSVKMIVREVAEEFEKEFYNSNSHLKKYLKPLTSDLLTQWFTERALEIESRTLLLTSAIQLLSLGTELNIKNLKCTQENLREFNEIVYECCADSNIYLSYDEFNKMSDIERLFLITGDSIDHCKNRFRQYVIPYIHRREMDNKFNLEQKGELLRKYFRKLANNREKICKTVYNHLLDCIEEDNFVAEWTKDLDDTIDEIGIEIKKIERERQVKLLADMFGQNLALEDYSACYEACQLIMDQNFKENWQLCCQLGTLKQFKNNEAKYKLLAFALAHCDDPDGRLSAKILNHVAELRMRDEKILRAYCELNQI